MNPFNPWRSLERDQERHKADELAAIREDLERAGIPLNPRRFTDAHSLRTARRELPVYPVEVRFDPSIVKVRPIRPAEDDDLAEAA